METDVKVKVLIPTAWKKKPLKKGETLNIPKEVADLNPSIFEVLGPAEPEPAEKEK